jgi:protein lifeguard
VHLSDADNLIGDRQLFDTYMIINRLSPDEWVIAVVSLYLDVLNLFLSILRLLNNIQSD